MDLHPTGGRESLPDKGTASSSLQSHCYVTLLCCTSSSSAPQSAPAFDIVSFLCQATLMPLQTPAPSSFVSLPLSCTHALAHVLPSCLSAHLPHADISAAMFYTMPATQMDNPFPKNFQTVVKSVFRRLFRVFAHVYHHHVEHIQALDVTVSRSRNSLTLRLTPPFRCSSTHLSSTSFTSCCNST